ncbi:winged helix-turn-helix domain-containing protein [Halogeometricum sp. S1BR25-6]|uniref:Winged helix-turn-helix domain-containing protein n=1 Tax=Halogeometricum salsisoli TaxID=2950536 RepID=A0ABU2G9M9_9EURY|nr:winged helix-turn-helix domain-containing protein [Halogeometricum sp. S1BR25-6]MDS0297495.1 winged helix-turn-helix domain-containing protein [Halogeometricum sp. S1BR25-6]
MTTHRKPGHDVADILPFRSDAGDDDDKEPRVVGLDGEEVSDLLSAISSETARSILSSLHEEPATPSEVADRADTSIQNAQYHLGRLEDAGLIEPGGTVYSEKGREMTVYAPADRALVVVAGREEDTSGLRSVLSRLLGGLGVVALGSVVVDRLTRTAAGPTVSLAGDGGGGGGEGGAAPGASDGANATGATGAESTSTPAPAPTATPTDARGGGVGIAEAPSTTAGEATSTETATRAAEATRTAIETAVGSGADTGAGAGSSSVVGALSTLAPAELFFLGGVATLVCATAYWWVTR